MTEPLLNVVSARAAELLVSSVWMGLALVACVALLLRCVPRLSAASRSRIWSAVLLLVVLLPLLLCFRGKAGSAAGSGEVHAGVAWSYLLAGAWAAFSLIRLVQLAASALRLREVARRAAPVAVDGALAEMLAQSERRVTLSVSGDVSRPSVAGFFRPQILLPVGLMEELSEAELEHVLLHELEHLRRRDDWTNLAQKFALALFPLHPATLWLDRRLCMERELACDDGVLRVTRARKAYAACLARLAEDSLVRRGLSLALGLLGPARSELSQRVHRILLAPAAVMGRMQAGAVTALVIAGVAGGSVVLAGSPRMISFGETPEAIAQTEAAMPTAMEPVRAAVDVAKPFRAVAARAVMPASTIQSASAPVTRRAHVVRTVALSRKPQGELRRVAMLEPPESVAMPQPVVVFTAWEQSVTMPRMTMAVMHDAQDFRDSQGIRITREAQPTYAAVPVRGGWLLIQL